MIDVQAGWVTYLAYRGARRGHVPSTEAANSLRAELMKRGIADDEQLVSSLETSLAAGRSPSSAALRAFRYWV